MNKDFKYKAESWTLNQNFNSRVTSTWWWLLSSVSKAVLIDQSAMGRFLGDFLVIALLNGSSKCIFRVFINKSIFGKFYGELNKFFQKLVYYGWVCVNRGMVGGFYSCLFTNKISEWEWPLADPIGSTIRALTHHGLYSCFTLFGLSVDSDMVQYLDHRNLNYI